MSKTDPYSLLDEIEKRVKAATHESTALYCDGAYGFKTNRGDEPAAVFVAYPIETDCTAAVQRLVVALREALARIDEGKALLRDVASWAGNTLAEHFPNEHFGERVEGYCGSAEPRITAILRGEDES